MKFQPLKASLAHWKPSARKSNPLDTMRALWPAAVGPDIARHTMPVAIEGTVLVITTRSGAWNQQLGFLESKLLSQLHAGSDAQGITALRFRVGRVSPVRETPVPPHRVVQARLALSVEPAPTASAADLVARMAARAADRERRLAKVRRCKSCGLPLEREEFCAPCRGRFEDTRQRNLQRVLREMPWLTTMQLREYVAGASLPECAAARRSLQSRLERQIEQIRWRLKSGGLPRSAERELAVAYTMLISGEPPTALSDAVLRHILGAAFAAQLYPNGLEAS
jgi:hypothetical protein